MDIERSVNVNKYSEKKASMEIWETHPFESERERGDVIARQRSPSAIGGEAIRGAAGGTARPSDRLRWFHRRLIRRRRRHVQGLYFYHHHHLFHLLFLHSNSISISSQSIFLLFLLLKSVQVELLDGSHLLRAIHFQHEECREWSQTSYDGYDVSFHLHSFSMNFLCRSAIPIVWFWIRSCDFVVLNSETGIENACYVWEIVCFSRNFMLVYEILQRS